MLRSWNLKRSPLQARVLYLHVATVKDPGVHRTGEARTKQGRIRIECSVATASEGIE